MSRLRVGVPADLRHKGIEMYKITATILAATVLVSGAAQASVTNITGTDQALSFTSFATPGAPGVHGLELRTGNNAPTGDWEIGLGPQTSVAGSFVQTGQSWGPTDAPTLFEFEYIYSGGSADFFLWNASSAKPETATISNTGLLTGNALEISTKRLAVMNLTEVDGHAMSFVLGDLDTNSSQTVLFTGASLLDGFNVKGTFQLSGQRGGSFSGAVIKAGNVTAAPVPLPAALPLLAAGLGGLALLRRRKA